IMTPRCDNYTEQAVFQYFAPGYSPFLVSVRRKKMSFIQAGGFFAERRKLISRGFPDLPGYMLQRKAVHPAVKRVYAQLPCVVFDNVFSTEQSSQTAQRHFKGLVRKVALCLGPERIGQLLLRHIFAAEGDKGLEQIKGVFLDLPGNHERLVVPDYLKPAESIDFYRIRPVFNENNPAHPPLIQGQERRGV